ncbi:hypothetical protein BH18CHL2_BH18CHL2_01950 [soil metagenome]
MTDRVTVVGVFRDDDAARAVLPRMTEAGFPPDSVGVVAGNVRQAREVAGSFSPRGALAGAIVGLLIGVVFAFMMGGDIGSNPIALALGGVGFGFAGAAIGALAGRAKALQPRDYEKYERAVDMGDALVTISCDPVQQGRARSALEQSGATAVRVEGTGDTV